MAYQIEKEFKPRSPQFLSEHDALYGKEAPVPYLPPRMIPPQSDEDIMAFSPKYAFAFIETPSIDIATGTSVSISLRPSEKQLRLTRRGWVNSKKRLTLDLLTDRITFFSVAILCAAGCAVVCCAVGAVGAAVLLC